MRDQGYQDRIFPNIYRRHFVILRHPSSHFRLQIFPRSLAGWDCSDSCILSSLVRVFPVATGFSLVSLQFLESVYRIVVSFFNFSFCVRFCCEIRRFCVLFKCTKCSTDSGFSSAWRHFGHLALRFRFHVEFSSYLNVLYSLQVSKCSRIWHNYIRWTFHLAVRP